MFGQVNRLQPRLPAHAMKTYEISAPLETHWRVASCKEVECDAYAHGWMTTIDTSTPLGAKQANYIRLHSGRRYTANPVTLGSAVYRFVFPPGQQCFREHRVRLDRQELYVVRGGDWRGNPRREGRRHTRPEFWVEDFAEHQSRIAAEVQKG